MISVKNKITAAKTVPGMYIIGLISKVKVSGIKRILLWIETKLSIKPGFIFSENIKAVEQVQ